MGGNADSNGRGSALPRAIIVLLATCLLATSVQALMDRQDIPELTANADEIVRGTITNVRSQWTPDRTDIITTATVTVQTRLKGRGQNQFTLTVFGGTVDGTSEWVEDEPGLVQDAEVYLFTRSDPAWGARVAGGTQGLLPVADGQVTGASVGTSGGISVAEFDQYLEGLAKGEAPSVPHPVEISPRAVTATPIISTISPSIGPAGTDMVVTITGTGFGTKAYRQSTADVAFFYRVISGTDRVKWASGRHYGFSGTSDIISWADTIIKVRVPEGVSSGWMYVCDDAGVSSTKAPFTVTFGYHQWVWSPQQHPFYVVPGGYGSNVVSAVGNAMNSWNSAVPNSGFTFTITSGDYPGDGNVVMFLPGSEMGGTAKGECALWGSPAPDGKINHIQRAEIHLNSDYSWTTGTASGNTLNVESVVLHELGHCLSLSDLYGALPGYASDVPKTMFGFGGDSWGNMNDKTLDATDIAGIKWIYSPDVTPTATETPTPTPTAAEEYRFVTRWGDYGDGDGQFNSPGGVSVDSAGSVYVADTYNDRIQKFTSTGTFLTKWGRSGIGDGQLENPEGIAVDAAGNVYVADTYNHRVQKFSSTGTFLTKWGGPGDGDGQFNWPEGIAVDSAGNVYVADTYNHRIQKFSSTGTFLTKWGRKGFLIGEFSYPDGIAADTAGNVYIADSLNDRIQKFSSTGTFLTMWDSAGIGNGQFENPEGIAVDSAGNVYVGDSHNHRVQKFTSAGTFLTTWGSNGAEDGQFFCTPGVSVDTAGYVYVTDNFDRVQKFARLGAPPAVIVPGGSAVPRDLNGDETYEDVNGNGRADFADVVLYFNQMSWIAAHEPVALFDFNGNGRIDFADVVWLFTHL